MVSYYFSSIMSFTEDIKTGFQYTVESVLFECWNEFGNSSLSDYLSSGPLMFNQKDKVTLASLIEKIGVLLVLSVRSFRLD